MRASLLPGEGRNWRPLLFIRWHLQSEVLITVVRHDSSRFPIGSTNTFLFPTKSSVTVLGWWPCSCSDGKSPDSSQILLWQYTRQGRGGLAASNYLVGVEVRVPHVVSIDTARVETGLHILVRVDHWSPHSVFAGIGEAWAKVFSMVFDWRRVFCFFFPKCFIFLGCPYFWLQGKKAFVGISFFVCSPSHFRFADFFLAPI